MKIVDINTAIPNQLYRVYIDQSAAKTIKQRVYSGHGYEGDEPINAGWYDAMFRQCVYAVGQPKWWEIQYGDQELETDNSTIKGYCISDLDAQALSIINK